ncbi:MAG: NADH-quinone oxidoreductase subunit 5 family protein, partial [Nocardioidaceae bacterium]
AGVFSTAAAWAGALWLGFEHWGQGVAADVVGPYDVPTGGIPLEPSLRLDQLSVSMLVLATTVALLVQVYSVAYLRGDPRYPSYVALVAVFTSAMGLVVAADDLFALLVGWEVMGACSYYLISHHWELEPARSGAVKAFLMTRLGDVGLLFGIFVAGDAAGTYRISGVIEAAVSGRIDESTATAATLLLLCGVVGKSAQFPLHSWLPDAMPGPTPISALIHAATMVAAGVFLVARLLPLFLLSDVTMTVLALIAAVTMVGSALFALATYDLKRVLAWSTVSQLAYMFGALALGSYATGVLHLLSHGAFKALLFLAAGSVIHAVGTQQLTQMGGLRTAMPTTFVTMTIGFAALAGVPPLVGFWSKDAVLGVAWEQATHDGDWQAWMVLVVGLAVAALTAAYSTRAWLLVFFGPSRGTAATRASTSASRTAHESPGLMTAPLVALALLTVVGGAAVVWPSFLGVEGEDLHLVVAILSLSVVAVAGLFIWSEWRRLDRHDPASSLGRLRPALIHEAAWDDLVDVAVVRPTRGAAVATRLAESDVVETYVRGGDGAAQWSARLIRAWHDGNLQRYVSAVAVGALLVGLVLGVTR